jgi:hypothetical protein
MRSRVGLVERNGHLHTDGLKNFIGHEVKVLIKEWPVQSYSDVLIYLIDYIVHSGAIIRNEQTIAYHSWLLKFVLDSESEIHLYEVRGDGEGFVEGVDYALKVVYEQIKVCEKFNATPRFPTFSQMIAISDGVYEGMPIEGVRYPSPEHMTGWWLSTNLYDVDRSVKPVHYFHIAFKRPDLLKYLALPFGYRFRENQKQAMGVWFDSTIE